MLLQLDDNLPPPAQALPAVPHGVTLPELKLHDLYQGLRPAGPAQPTSLPAAMSEAETALLSALAAKAARVVEFGCGGSTRIMLAAGAARILSVDSDATWLQRVASGPEGEAACRAGRLIPWHVDIGPTGDWGWPSGPVSADTAWRYWGAPWLVMPPAELVMVDGRFRIACALAAHGQLAQGGHVAVHDWWPRRAYQEALAPFFDVVGSAGTLALLSPRKIGRAEIEAALERHGTDPR
ncbi:MAG: hypothetical protein NTW56_15625 [Alphaproteobacteria bacterium]|nr:hypothetical protein [Alphaproteobacteria bacterium]